jgi:hypothetical protein
LDSGNDVGRDQDRESDNSPSFTEKKEGAVHQVLPDRVICSVIELSHSSWLGKSR